jgi:hypothetical protein
MAAVLGYVRANWREFQDLVANRRGVVPGERVATRPVGLRPALDDGVRRQIGAGVLGVAGLAPAMSARCRP